MSKVKFNEDIMKRLGKHRYVKEINEKQIKFTDEFKSIIVREYEAGKRARQIMEEAQIPFDILGVRRIDSLIQRCVKQSRRQEGFKRKKMTPRPLFNNEGEELQYYKDQVEYMKQVLEFTKKIEALEKKEAVRLARAKNIKSSKL